MRVGWVVALGALALISSIALAQLTSAQTPTPTGGPTDTPSPTPASTPSPTPYAGPTSTITVRFVRNGQPATVFAFSKIIKADGVTCGFPSIEGEISTFTVQWPLFATLGQPTECSKGPPTTLRFEFSGLALFSEALWTGTDITVDVEVPATVTPGVLPPTGGSP